MALFWFQPIVSGCFATFQSKSAPVLYQLRYQQSDSCLTPVNEILIPQWQTRKWPNAFFHGQCTSKMAKIF